MSHPPVLPMTTRDFRSGTAGLPSARGLRNQPAGTGVVAASTAVGGGSGVGYSIGGRGGTFSETAGGVSSRWSPVSISACTPLTDRFHMADEPVMSDEFRLRAAAGRAWSRLA